jgi:integrase
MAGRPPLRIGQHGKITRNYLGAGVWLARTRFRDSDGVVRIVERRGPADDHDQHGKLAEDLLVEALASRKSPASGDVSLDTPVMALVGAHIDQLTEDGRAAKTLDTYRYVAVKLAKFVGAVRVGEASAARLNAALRSMHTAHGTVAARTSKSLLRGGLQLAVMANVLGTNPVRDVQPIQAKRRPKGASALTADRLRDLLAKVRASEYCRKHDVVDPITLFIATGVRLSELLALRWSDFDEDTGMITVRGKVVRVKGKGLVRSDDTKSAAGQRTIPLPRFAISALVERRKLPFLGGQPMIFPSTEGTLRDPGNLSRLWRGVREDLGVPEVTSHSFRKTVATLIDDEGLSARIGADQLGHAKVSMTQDAYMSRGRVHTQVAELLDRTINDE